MSKKSIQLETSAREAEYRRDWDMAYTLWEQRRALSPLTPEVMFQLVRSATYANRMETARELVGSLTRESAAAGPLAMLRADICERSGEHAEALRWRRAAAKVSPDDYWVLFGTARAMLALKHNVAEVLAEMKAAMKLPAAEHHGALFTAKLLFKQGEFDAGNKLVDAFVPDEEQRETWCMNVLPGMTFPKERNAGRELARNLSGKGKIVDLGCWLGSLTAALASGLKSNKHRQKPSKVIAYDLFEWAAGYMETDWPGSQFGLKEHDDFLPWFKQWTKRWKSLIDVRKSDLSTVQWTEGDIALLVVDAMKTEKLSRHIMATFYPRLLQDAYLFHQDFCHYYTWWIHLYHYPLRHKFKVVDKVDGCGTVVFQLTEPLREAEVQAALLTNLADPKLAEAAFDYSLSIVNEADHKQILRAFLNCEVYHKRGLSAARIEKRIAALP